jgi:hypothetical protein
MRALRSWLLVVVSLIPAGAHAGDHKADVFVALSYLDAKGSSIKLGGWHVSAAATPNKLHPKLSLLGDLSVHYLGSGDDGKRVTQITFMAGPRLNLLGGHHHMVFTHLALFAAVHRTGGELIGGNSAGAVAVGAGWDCAAGTDRKWGSRLQVDWIEPVRSELGRGIRISAGLLYRFKFPMDEKTHREKRESCPL